MTNHVIKHNAPEAGQVEQADGLTAEALIEEVSIDGMCGVY